MRLSLFSNALVAVLVGFGGSVAIVLSGIHAVGATPAQSASWISALCLAMFATSTILSVLHRMPIVTAWSTPGAALIAATAIGGVPTYSIEVAVGAFLFAAALILLSAAVKPLATLIAKIPSAIASAMLAGVLIGFSIAVFDQAAQDPLLVLPLIAVFLIVRMVSATWAVIAVLGAGIAWAAILGKIAPMTSGIELTELELITPVFDPAALIGLGLPLFLVSMASQNLPGFAVLRAAGYEPPARSALAVTGLASLLTAPFGAHTTTLAAITASLCTGPDTHPDPAKRWVSGIFYGLGYLILAGVGVSVVAGFAALPTAVIATVAGLALIGPLMGSMSAALAPEATRFPAVLTLTATASGLSLFGIGSAFWGLVLGLLALGLDKLAKKMRG
ncbi:MAG: benzoate/H(+) symporter BenE family transporter [Alphaproteobacteria bacterium]|nr:benzoate/H(+) symporter BenE family transporter [Alphaproteobacteria bacterium]